MKSPLKGTLIPISSPLKAAAEGSDNDQFMENTKKLSFLSNKQLNKILTLIIIVLAIIILGLLMFSLLERKPKTPVKTNVTANPIITFLVTTPRIRG